MRQNQNSNSDSVQEEKANYKYTLYGKEIYIFLGMFIKKDIR